MQKLFVLALCFYNAKSYDANDCHFARNYDAASLFNSTKLQEEFLLRASWWQGTMARGVIGTQYATTRATVWFLTDNVNPRGYIHIMRNGALGDTDGESEAIHLLLLAAALDGDIYALEFVKSAKNSAAFQSLTTEDFILGMLGTKYRFYVEFLKRYPGYGGYLPLLKGFTLMIPEPHENNELLARSNAMFCWAMIAVSQVTRVLDKFFFGYFCNVYIRVV